MGSYSAINRTGPPHSPCMDGHCTALSERSQTPKATFRRIHFYDILEIKKQKSVVTKNIPVVAGAGFWEREALVDKEHENIWG